MQILLVKLVFLVAARILFNLRFSMEKEEQLPPTKKKRLSLSVSKRKKEIEALEESVSKKPRFESSSASEIESASKKFVPKNTSTSLKLAYNIFCQWIEHNNRTISRQYSNQDLWFNQDAESLVTMLSQFCLEVRQCNGKPYTPKSILQILSNLQNYSRTMDSDCLQFMCSKDPRFERLHTVLDNTSRQLHKDAEEQCLWDTGVMATDNPTSLLNGVFFYCGMYLCLRGGGEHRNMKYSQVVIKTVVNLNAPSETIKCLNMGPKIEPGLLIRYTLTTKR